MESLTKTFICAWTRVLVVGLLDGKQERAAKLERTLNTTVVKELDLRLACACLKQQTGTQMEMSC